MKIIKLTQNQFTKVDNEDFERLNKHKWCFDGDYAVRRKNRKKTYMHREIMKAKKGKMIDHKNHDSLDNRKGNLRFCTQAQNLRNKGKPVTNTSGFVGVTKAKHLIKKPWVARIKFKQKNYYLGVYETPEQASEAYKKATKKYFGEFAYPFL